jgi:hypothetical protein
LPKSCHSLNLGVENFAGRLNGRLWPDLLYHTNALDFSTAMTITFILSKNHISRGCCHFAIIPLKFNYSAAWNGFFNQKDITTYAATPVYG